MPRLGYWSEDMEACFEDSMAFCKDSEGSYTKLVGNVFALMIWGPAEHQMPYTALNSNSIHFQLISPLTELEIDDICLLTYASIV